MTKTKKRVLYGVLTVLGASIIGLLFYLNSLLPIITGYAAKNLASDVFLSGRKQSDIESLDLNFSFIKFTKNEVSAEDSSVTSRFLWGSSKAIYRNGFGVTLLRNVKENDLRKIGYPGGTKPSYARDSIKWPLGDIISDTLTGINLKALGEISGKVIKDNGYHGNVFAFLVVHKGIPVAENYKPGLNMNTRFLSWSMGKSFINAQVGILAREKGLDIFKPTGLEVWKNDDRSKITLNDLMHMESGLKWNEEYGNRSDVTVMLHCESDMGKYAYEQPLENPIGSKWYYSSGTTNIVSYIIRKQFENDSLYYSFSNNYLFNKIGMADAVFETDPSGTRVGSSYLYATARDYARFALLFQNDGVFNGERILPEGWVKYTTTPADKSDGTYGAFFWLNKGKRYPSAPADMYGCEGHDGQYIFIMPTQQLIVVLLGFSPRSTGGIDCDRLLNDVINAL